jgi:malate dehydrogenase
VKSKITVVGAGEPGATATLLLARRDYAELVLLDADGDLARARALDIAHAATAAGHEPLVSGTADWSEAAGASIVVIAADRASVEGVTADLARCCPDAIVMVAGEPVAELCQIVRDATLFTRQRVLGVSGVVEVARLRTAIARELGVSVHDVTALVAGGPGDAAVMLLSHTSVAGTPVVELLDVDRLRAVTETARHAGSGPAAVAAAVCEVTDAIVRDRRRVLPCVALCQGEYGVEGAFTIVPVRLGQDGIEEIVEVSLTESEREALARATARAAPSGA